MATNEQQAVKQWMVKFGQKAPDKPVIPSLEIRKLRAKLILEEALETINNGLGIGIEFIAKDVGVVLLNDINLGDFQFCSYGHGNIEEIADGCEDLKVVTEGTLVACGLTTDTRLKEGPIGFYNYDPLFNEVMRSNESKLWTVEEFNAHVKDNCDNPNWIPTTILDPNNPEKILGFIIKDKDGKVLKSPSYSPPNLQPIIEEMSK